MFDYDEVKVKEVKDCRFTLRLNKQLLNQFDKIAEKQEVNKSQIVHNLIMQYIKHYEEIKN